MLFVFKFSFLNKDLVLKTAQRALMAPNSSKCDNKRPARCLTSCDLVLDGVKLTQLTAYIPPSHYKEVPMPCPAQQWPDPTVLIHFNPLLKTKPRTGAKLHCPAQVLCRFLWEHWLWLPYAGEARKWSSMPSIYILTFLSDIQVKRFRSPKLNSLWCQYLVPI